MVAALAVTLGWKTGAMRETPRGQTRSVTGTALAKREGPRVAA